MAWNPCFSALLFFRLAAVASSTVISGDVFESRGSTGRTLLQAKKGDVFESRGSTGRTLLQAKKGCPVNFESLNYTIITSQCKGPQYPPKLCCNALKDFACPHAAELNDLTNDCASTMFSYINLNGKYPPGLFASECKEGKEGLECPATAPTKSAHDDNRGLTCQAISPVLMFTVGFIVLLVQMFLGQRVSLL